MRHFFVKGVSVMNLLEVVEKFPDQQACITHLEELRWNGNPLCPYCDSERVKKRNETKHNRIGLWTCRNCEASFKAIQDTIFHGTHIELKKWFMAIALIVNAKKSMSSYQLARDLSLNQKTAWYIMSCIRVEMARDKVLLQGVVEADETYIGTITQELKEQNKRGRGTVKTPIMGVVQRGGKVAAQVATDLKGETLLEFIRGYVDIENSELITDEYKAYNVVGKHMKHSVINHQEEYVNGDIHTNTIEGFWALLKRAWKGSHHHYSREYTPLYVAEACYKYNYRNENMFDKFLKQAMQF
ncbi:hypothetical protein C6501_05600 [Candidatus Poribacteria bacterium]|nr:MAG: hypothetical protein C6501_05600 [Candidatus Poribacteria bacterium]